MLAARWLKRLPESYRAAVEPLVAAEDVERSRRWPTAAPAFVVLQDERAARTRAAHARRPLPRGPKIELAQAPPMLEDLGLRVIEEIPTRLHGDDELWVQDFGVLTPTRRRSHRAAAAGRCRGARGRALEAVYRGEPESDIAQPPGRHRRA